MTLQQQELKTLCTYMSLLESSVKTRSNESNKSSGSGVQRKTSPRDAEMGLGASGAMMQDDC